jgi:hypothetical protein
MSWVASCACVTRNPTPPLYGRNRLVQVTPLSFETSHCTTETPGKAVNPIASSKVEPTLTIAPDGKSGEITGPK